MEPVLYLLGGLVIGSAIVLAVMWIKSRQTKALAEELVSKANSEKLQDVEQFINRMKESFGSISMDALSKSSKEFLQLANESLSKQTQLGEKNLETKKALIENALVTMNKGMQEQLQSVQKLVSELEKDRENKFGELAQKIKTSAEETAKLRLTADQLRNTLASPQARGQWGERMAEDILHTAGFIEGINYRKQQQLDSSAARPDYTFLLPHNLKVNMDVKFPLSNYLRFIESESESDRENHKKTFFKDVKKRISEILNRNYINPEDNTVDCVIIFVPNEQVYSFIHENDPTVLDEALKNKVIMCSPFTLFAVLAVIRHAVDNFMLEQTAGKIREHLAVFQRQYAEFVKSLEKIGKKIAEAQDEFDRLNSTRRNQLEKPLRAIDGLGAQEGLFEENTEVIEEIEGTFDSKMKNNQQR